MSPVDGDERRASRVGTLPARRSHFRGRAGLGVLCLAVFLLLVGVAACDDATPAKNGVGATTGPGSAVSATPGAYREVAFTTDDGVTLSGRLFGSGEAGIVLAHMYPADQTSWRSTAERLAGEGYLVLTFDFRGYGDSEGSKDIDLIDRDVFAAIMALADAGAGRILLIGASMGGTACLVAADESQPLSRVFVSGVATLSAPVEFKGLSAEAAVPRLAMPLLFIAAERDAGADGANVLEALSGGAGELRIVPGDDHGTELLQGEHADEIWELLLGFVRKNLPLLDR